MLTYIVPVPNAKNLPADPLLENILSELRMRIEFYSLAFRLPFDLQSGQDISNDLKSVKKSISDRLNAFLDNLN